MSTKKIRIGIGIVIFIVLIGGFLLFNPSEKNFFDDKQKEGELTGMSEEELQQSMDEAAMKNMLKISIKDNLRFKNGTAKCDMRIENSKQNLYHLSVTIALQDNGKIIYESGAIKPGSFIKEDALDTVLKKGKYAVNIIFTAYDLKSHKEVGKSIVKNHILIEE